MRPEVFETRWAMSYLRGPLTRKQIKTLMDPQGRCSGGSPPPAGAGTAPPSPRWPRGRPRRSRHAGERWPAAGASPDIPQHFVPGRGEAVGLGAFWCISRW